MEKKELKRVSDVVGVLLKQGLGHAIEKLSLKLHLPFSKRFLMHNEPVDDIPARLRKSMEELGGAFIKLGQLLSLRPDLVPREYCEEFKKLLDDVPPISFSEIKKQIELSTKNLSGVFREINPKPLGSGSVAQVHKAKLKNNKDVVVKVLRPGVREKFSADINVMRYIASKINSKLPSLPVTPSKIIEEFERYTKNELNLVFEARNIERINKQKHSVKIIIPKIYWPATTNKVLVMDFIAGKKLHDIRNPDKKYADIIINELFSEVFDYGFFHADLHPGNVIIMPDKKVGFIDFGIVGSIDDKLKNLGLIVYRAVISKDVDSIMHSLMKYGTPSENTDLGKLKQTIGDLVNEWYDSNGKSRASHIMHELFNSCIENNFKVPENAVLFAKALVTGEGTCLYIDPNFNFVKFAEKKSSKILSKLSSPKELKKYFEKEGKKFFDNVRELPEEGLDLIRKLNTDRFELNLDDSHFRRIGFNISSSSNRLSFAMIITALIIASALLIDVGPFIDGYPVFSIIGMIFAGFLMVLLFMSIINEPKRKF